MAIVSDTSDPIANRMSWQQIMQALARSKKLRVRIIDTVFLRPSTSGTGKHPHQITDWFFTSKRGDFSRRRDTSELTLQNVYDRFNRLVSTDSSNVGPKIIAVGYLQAGSKRNRINFTAEQMKREVKSHKEALFGGCAYIQCYRRQCQDYEYTFRGNYACRAASPHSNSINEKEREKIVTVHFVEETMAMIPIYDTSTESLEKNESSLDELGSSSSALFTWIQKEIEVLLYDIAQNLERSVAKLGQEDSCEKHNTRDDNMITKLSAEFILDSDRKLWLSHVGNVIFASDGDGIMAFDAILDNHDKFKAGDINATKSLSLKLSSQDAIKGNTSEEKEEQIADVPSDGHCTLNHDSIDGCGIEHRQMLNTKEGLVFARAATNDDLGDIESKSSRATSLISCSTNLDRQAKKQAKQRSSIRKECGRTKSEKASTLLEIENNIQDVVSEVHMKQGENGTLGGTITAEKDHCKKGDSEEENQTIIRRLENDIFSKTELIRNMGLELKESLQALRKAENEVEFLKTKVKNEKLSCEETVRHLGCKNKVLEAELKSQREYADELGTSVWTELATKVKEGVEAVTSRELSKSNIGSAKVIAACESRWKKRLEELNVEHHKELTKIREEHNNETRFKNSQFQIQLEEGRKEVVERLHVEHTKLLKATLAHKESQRQADVRNESKRWERMMSEMKARLHKEYEQAKKKTIQTVEEKWKSKVQQNSNQVSLVLEEERENCRQALQAANRQSKIDMTTALEKVKYDSERAIREALHNNEKKFKELLAAKEAEMQKNLQLERESVMLQEKEHAATLVSQAIEAERKKMRELKNSIAKIRSEHEEEKRILNQANVDTKKDMENLVKNRHEDRQKHLLAQVEMEREKIEEQCELKIEEIKKSNEVKLKSVRVEANKAIAIQENNVKQQMENLLKEHIQTAELRHEEQLQSMEYDLGWLKNQKDRAEATAQDLNNSLEKKNGKIEDLEKELKAQCVTHSFQKMRMITNVLHLVNNLKSKCDSAEAKILRIRDDNSESERRLNLKVDMFKKRSFKLEKTIKQITSTFLQKDALLEHKTKSREIAFRLNEVTEKMDVVDAKRQRLNVFIQNLEQAMHDVEKQLQDHAQTSALQGGKINISHARKKRKLDEEYDQILSKIEMKREDLNVVDEEAKGLHLEKDTAHEDMRNLEKSLVEILVTQQKNLLAICSFGENSKSALEGNGAT